MSALLAMIALGGVHCDGGSESTKHIPYASPDGSTEGEGGPDTSAKCLKTTCGAACVDTDTDASHCGACGNACGAGLSCCGGSCSTGCSLSIAPLAVGVGPVSGGTWVNVTGTGFVAGARVYFGAARAPALVLGPTSIRALSPPGVAAKVDVRVEQGSDKASRISAFQYAAYTFAGPWKKVALSTPRGMWPGVSVLLDGRVLMSGGNIGSGSGYATATAELYDPVTNTTTKTAGDLGAARDEVAQVTLLSGRALVIGTDNQNGVSPVAELYEPSTSTYHAVKGQPATQLADAAAVLLADGRVLVTTSSVGGVLLYDPTSDAFSAVDAAPNGPQYRPARLLDGRVLIEAPLGQTNYLFDPDTSQFTPAGPGPFSAGFPTCSLCDEIAYTLPDGRVWSSPGVVSDAMAVFDPAEPSAGFVKTTYTLPKPTTYAGTSMMGDGTVYFLGGSAAPQASCFTPGWSWLPDVVRVDPVAGTVTSFDALPEASGALAAASLQDGSIIAVGGMECGGISPVASLYFLKGQAPVIK